MRRKKLSVVNAVAFAAATVATLLPAYAHATTVLIGNPNVPASGSIAYACGPCTESLTFGQTFSSLTGVDFTPAAGVIKSWRVTGEGTLKLRVIEGGPEGGWLGEGTSAAASNVTGQPNATSLPIGAEDYIGLDFPLGSPRSGISVALLPNAEIIQWHPAVADDGIERETGPIISGQRLDLNAEVVLTPVLSSLSQPSGSTTGGNAVKISGLYLDGATSVTFGSAPASSFSVDSSNQITAIAPATAASTVDVRVTGPGGSSEVTSADKYTFTAPAAATNPTPTTLIQGGPGPGPPNPAVSGFGESASRWRRGHSLPHVSSVGAPVGTTFSFNLSEPATSTFTFTQRMAGRRAHGKCVAPSPGNAHGSKCKRTVIVGSFGASGKAGVNKLRFQGRLSSTKTLKPATYAVSITASDAHGMKGVSPSPSFTIVS